MAVNQEILLVSPVSACATLIRLMGEGPFYQAVFGSFGRILAGFALSTVLGVLLAALSYAFSPVRVLLRPLLSTIKATPVASITILALIWIRSKDLSVFISFLMVLPIAYENVLRGLDSADGKLLEMARVFRIPFAGRVRAIYAPAAFPMLLTAVRLSLGMCWKAGIAAEVIAQPRNSIGSALQQAKLFFATPEMFAWTLAIILLSVAAGKTGGTGHYGTAKGNGGGEVLSICGVCKAFDGHPVLENISFDFPEGAVTALRGPSGCGKTTLVNIILGLLKPDAGEVRMPANARVAAVFQEDRLIEHFSAAQNVRLAAPASVTDAQIRAALNGLGLADEGEKRVSQFSGGMRRRVAVIRAALYQPQVLLLDEPFKGLDDDMRAKTAAFLCRTCAQATTILVTHDGTEAALMGAQAGLDIGGKDGKE